MNIKTLRDGVLLIGKVIVTYKVSRKVENMQDNTVGI